MNREEFIGKLQMVYVGDRNAFNDIVCAYDELIKNNQTMFETKVWNINKNNELHYTISQAIEVLEELIAEFQLNNYITDFDKKMNKPLNILKGSDKK